MPAIRIAEFDLWRPGYGNAQVAVYIAFTTTPASIFYDENLTQPAPNPQTLIQKTDQAGVSYGKFQFPLYTSSPYYAQINNTDQTGVTRPALISLVGQDASAATAIPNGGIVASSLANLFSRRVDVRDYGVFLAVGVPGASTATNTATLAAAIGAVAAGGDSGYVDIPAGTFQVAQFTLPQGVVVRGAGRGTSVLQSNAAGNVATISGPRAGFFRITLDGISLVSLSVGIYAVNIDDFVLNDVEVKRFATGIYRRGGQRCNWRDLYISNCVNGYRANGDSISGTTGGPLLFNRWVGGRVDTCTGVGIQIQNIDQPCEHNSFIGIVFDTNTGIAVSVIGARYSLFSACRWVSNTTNVAVNDASPATAINTVVGLEFVDGETNSGALIFAGTYRNLAFRRMTMVSPAITISAPGQNIPVEDCQVSNPTFTGVQTCWLYRNTNDRGSAFTQTTGNAAAKSWSVLLKSGQQIYLEGKVVGRQQDGINTGFWHVAVSAGRPGASLTYNTQTGAFTLGKIVTGQTSGATARITANSAGTLTLQDVNGAFAVNEIIKDTVGGSATAGTFSESNAALIGAVTAIRAAQKTNANWNATFAASGASIELDVTGDTAQTVEWSVNVDVTSEQGSPLTIAAQASVFLLNYHGATGALPQSLIGTTITGVTSGAKATIITITVNPSDNTKGTLGLSNVVGVFQNGENANLGVGVLVIVG